MEVSHDRELGNQLMEFLRGHGVKMCLEVSPSLKRKRSGELHWTTDNQNIIHQDRIGGGVLGDVHRVLSPRGNC